MLTGSGKVRFVKRSTRTSWLPTGFSHAKQLSFGGRVSRPDSGGAGEGGVSGSPGSGSGGCGGAGSEGGGCGASGAGGGVPADGGGALPLPLLPQALASATINAMPQ